MKKSTRRWFLSKAGASLGAAALSAHLTGIDLAYSSQVKPKTALGDRESDPLTAAISGGIDDRFRFTQFANNRTDIDLVATLGTCYQNDFRFFTMLHQEAWDLTRWETLGNAVQKHRTWNNWPYEQRLHITANDANISQDLAQVDAVEQQFDFRQVKVSSPFVNIDRLDMMMSARQWTTTFRITNPLSIPTKITVELEWTGKNKDHLNVRPCVDQDGAGFAYSISDGPPILVALSPEGTWEKKGDGVVWSRWEMALKAGEATTLNLNIHIGWATMPEYKKEASGQPATDKQAAIDRRNDRLGFRNVMAALGVKAIGERWEDLQGICEVRRRYLYDRMPRLQGFAPEWAGLWAYVFDLMRSGVYPPQANFKDVWMVADLVVYREPFSWDGPASVHTFCNYDADLASRTLRTYLTGAIKADGELSVSSNPYRAFPNPTPQLANNTMALWDCYQITRDKAVLRDCYPLLVRHIRWLETKRNHTPDGPLMDVGYNIDYGPSFLYQTPTIWPDVKFFLVDHYRKLSQIAQAIGKSEQEQAEWADKADRLAKAIREHMWDEKTGAFWCVSDKLEFKRVPSPIEFFGMVTEVASQEQARRSLVRLKNPSKYAPNAKYPYGLPSAPFDSPYFVVRDSWSGTIWPIQTYYTVRGLADYGYQDEAAGLARTLYLMMARSYRETGTVWEQYDPHSGKDLNSIGAVGKSVPEAGRGYFISGISTSVLDTLLRGVFGFDRTDSPSAFYLTPRPLASDWHGIENLRLSGATRLSIQIKDDGNTVICKVKFSSLDKGTNSVAIHRINLEDGSKKLVKISKLNKQREVKASLEKSDRIRLLWEIL